MHLSSARWATAVATAALIALPCSALAQPNPAQNPPSQPPSQSQPAAQAPSQTKPSAAPSQNGQVDPAGAKQHLTEARDTLSQLTSMPEAAKLQGDARTQVSQLISNFNALITTQSDWRSAYAKVDDSLTTLLGPDSDQSRGGAASAAEPTGTSGAGAPAATGTTGVSASTNASPAAPSAIQLDPAIRAKLIEFRTHLNEFEKAAGGSSASPAPSSAASAPSAPSPSSEPSSAAATASAASTGASPASASGAMPPAAAPTSTSNPAVPSPAAKPEAAAAAESGAKPEATAKPYAGAKSETASAEAAGASSSRVKSDQNANAAAESELAAIDAILQKSKTGALTRAQTIELRRHVEALRALLNQK